MISSFSDARYLILGRSQSGSCFFQEAVLKGQLRDQIFQATNFLAQALYFTATGLGKEI